MYTEERLAPFIAENVKLNLKEVCDAIIKSEDGQESDRNICRLCLEFSDIDMTFSASEYEHFKKWFAEVVSIV